MNSSTALTALAEKLHNQSATDEEVAEFIRLVAQENSLEILKSLLPANYDYAGVVLQRITELIPNDPQAHLALALWKYNNGLDEEALELLEKSRALTPKSQDVLRADLWFSFGRHPDTILEKCQVLLKAFPDDHWAKDVCETVVKQGGLESLHSPRWNNRWQDLVNKPWLPEI